MVPSKVRCSHRRQRHVQGPPVRRQGPISDIADAIKPSVDAMFDDLVWWSTILREARAVA
jgi:hypothetical protein